MKKIIFLLLPLFLLTACNDKPQKIDEYKIWVEKRITQCAEEWHQPLHHNNEDFEEKLTEFYEKKNIPIFSVKPNQSLISGGACESCGCDSDTILKLQISLDDLKYFEDKRYQRIND